MSKLFTTEVSSMLEEKSIIELSEKVKNNSLQSDDKDAIALIDAFAKEVGNTGRTTENVNMVSELIKREVEPLVFNPDESILYDMFDVGNIGEFDEKMYTGVPKNTLVAHNATRGGNVPKSYVDPELFTPKSTMLQVETELNYSDLRRNGFKTIAKMSELTRDSLEQEMFFSLFAGIDNVLDSLTGSQNINGGSALTVQLADELASYVQDMSDGNPFMVGLSKYVNQMKRMNGYSDYMSDDMKNELNRFGLLSMYEGVRVTSIPTARKTANGKTLIPDKRIFGIAGKIGECDMRGELRMYETYDNNAEKVHLKFTGYEFQYAIFYLDKIARIHFS